MSVREKNEDDLLENTSDPENEINMDTTKNVDTDWEKNEKSNLISDQASLNPFSLNFEAVTADQKLNQKVKSTRSDKTDQQGTSLEKNVPGKIDQNICSNFTPKQSPVVAELPQKASKNKKRKKNKAKKSPAETHQPIPDEVSVQLFSNVFQVKNYNDMRNFDFTETPENVRGKAAKKSFKEPVRVPADELSYIRNTKARQQKCRTNLLTKEMSPSRFLYNLGDSGGTRDGGFAHAGYRWTRFLATQSAELNQYGQEQLLASPYADHKAFVMLAVLVEYMKNQCTNNPYWAEIIVRNFTPFWRLYKIILIYKIFQKYKNTPELQIYPSYRFGSDGHNPGFCHFSQSLPYNDE